jgi:autotransporter passenger strand-loop-strand repeat protein
MACEFIVSAGEVFDGLSAGNGQPNQTIYVLPGGEITNIVVFGWGWDLLSANTVAIDTTVMAGAIECVYGAVSSNAMLSSGTQEVAGGVTVGTQVIAGAELVGDDGQAFGTTVSNGTQAVLGNGFASGTVLATAVWKRWLTGQKRLA